MRDLDNAAIAHFAGIAGVPDEHRELFSDSLKQILARARSNAARAGGADQNVPSISAEATKQLCDAAKAFRKAREALDALDGEAASYFACALAADENYGLENMPDGSLRIAINDAFLMTDVPSTLEETRRQVRNHAVAASSALAFTRQQALDAMKKEPNSAGEAPNPRFTAFDWLVFDVLILVRIVRGNLSVNDAYPDKPGSLWSFYQDLRDYLQPDFPEQPSLSRLRRLRELSVLGKK